MMLPEEDRQALKKNGYNMSANGVISPIAHPLQTHNRKSSSSEAQLHRQGERDSLNNPRPIQPKATPTTSNTRRYGSADAAERWSAGSNPKPKPTPNLRGMSADAAERWSAGSSPKPKPKATPTALNTRLYGSADAEERRHAGSTPQAKPKPNLRGMSADAAERWSAGSSSKPQLAIAPRGEQNNNNALNQTNNVVKGTVVGNAVAKRKLSQVAAGIEQKVRSAQAAQGVLSSFQGETLLRKKTVAGVIGGKPALSGWKQQPTVVDRVLKSSAEDLGRKLRRSGAIDRGVDGRYLASHAEKQVSITNPNKPIGVSRAMCLDCKDHFKEVAHYSKKQQVVADPKVTRVFHPNRQIDVLPNHIDTENLSKYAKEAATRPLKDKGGLSKAVVNGLENSHLQRAFKVAAPVAAGLDAVNLYNVYHKDGFGKDFRKEAGSVAGSWGGAAAGAAIGTAIFPGVGTVVGGVIGGVAGSEFGDDIEQGAEKAGKAIADGAKNAWNKLFG